MIRKASFILVVCLFVMLTISNVGAFDLPGVKKDTGVKVDANALSQRSAAVMSNVRVATISFAEALLNIETAVGHKEQAEKLQQVLNNAKAKSNDENATKALIDVNNNALSDLDNVDLNKSMNKEMANKTLGDSVLKIGVGVIYDAIAVKDASVLLNEAQSAVKSVSFSAVGKVKDVISVSTFVGKEIPPQASQFQKISGKLVDYANTNGIPTPSKDDVQKKVKEMQEG